MAESRLLENEALLEPYAESTRTISAPQWRSVVYLIGLTTCFFGVQLAWSIEFGYGTPYLFSLGLRKEWTSIIWIAGPLTGVFVQPMAGMLSDRCTSRFGRRRPFMICASFLGMFSLMLMGWAPWLSSKLFPESSQKVAVNILATLSIYMLDIGVNTVMASSRSLIVDVVRSEQQQDANSWAGRMIGVGNVVGYLFGYLPLQKMFFFLGTTQLQVLCALAAILLISSVVITCLIVEEVPNTNPPQAQVSVFKELFHFFTSLKQEISFMPASIKNICYVQFFAYFAWFPFLFYITTYVGDLYLQHPPPGHEGDWDIATRQGSFALLLFAIVSLCANTTLPLLVEDHGESESDQLSHDSSSEESSLFHRSLHTLRYKWSAKMIIPGLSLPLLWLSSHVVFGVCMLSTFVLQTATQAQVMIAICGFSWACTLWAPFALLSSELARLELQESGGKMIGVHNIFVSAPQVLSTIIATIVFLQSEGSHREVGDSSIAWILRIGGISAFIAAFQTTRVLHL
ncbi:alpha-glucoside transporter Sut1 [Schizosaccharomyces japonicus yFS275]|uniref:Alpha-glucoside transporter Sut1 n=1 Tax=Schizosaccharomyces japonicus (strain yFS275 / FY16936) TaxID=402676 RepID=B6K5I6_SCHJY|nr:alpha-glucoside transporter Sut1 [Schizosaccharomyces japonicus yFS275]EEB08790.1 alpha-glucoside transporter Sut1 [Schizosaccharomyces japonicus yFS275]